MIPRKLLMHGLASDDPTAFGMRLAAAGREDPIYFEESLGLPVVLRSADIQAVLRDEATFSTRVFQMGLMKDTLIGVSGDAHVRARKLYSSFFAPNQIAGYEHDIVAPAIDEVLDELARVEHPDLYDDFCMKVPQRVVSRLFGMPSDRINENDVRVRGIIKAITRPMDPEAVAAGNQAYAEISTELFEIARRELADPTPTLFGEIAKALIANGEGTVEACERIVLTLVLGSYETTAWGLMSIAGVVLRYPELCARLRREPTLLPNAIEESWRWCGSILGTVRFVEREVELAGSTLSPGTVVQLSWSGAHFEPEVYPKPELFDPERKVKPLLFGAGPHFCAGAALARMETRVAMSRLLARFPELRADPSRPAPLWSYGTRGSLAYGPDHLPAILN